MNWNGEDVRGRASSPLNFGGKVGRERRKIKIPVDIITAYRYNVIEKSFQRGECYDNHGIA